MEYAAFRSLQTTRLRLRKLTIEDVPAYYARLTGSEAVTRFMLFQPHLSLSEAEASIRKVLCRYDQGRCYRWGITLRQDGSLIGIIDLLAFDEARNTCFFAYMLAEAFWGKGYGTEALCAVLEYAFDVLHVDAVIADHFRDNPASGAVMQKAGMRPTGITPKKYEKNGVTHDAVAYRITRDDWSRRK